ncbi:MAG: di-trans,poly-cis-decaprenylcistransferase [Rhodocyclaceae bacterium]|jgi:undecaprenyl diphosphate synthase|nr:di-trans,poly-cis-decaprenylcistransferase [Rhodocyclaceae bacterium]MCE2722158.1 polyprenyl diphosphate synthase [Betaproteobacteria bacterium]MCA3018631.1 di-trans,poly-cis-decaprenylcistransferase [Rhodocyclaceae bacterium]MCA3022867.1 di-trans,poly-cis-decaprenylcistransferase [Rhodocyclaceae bacterium]MCA3024827.1 di-trans,poly-cis-decaprenylcistransferase [Rhodocyclaceae bacterium]
MNYESPTQVIPAFTSVPRHVAIVMDGNGRWAKNRFMPRVAGHKRGVEAVRETVKTCGELGIEYLTLFAFSSENWRRPAEEVSVLMQLFLVALDNEVAKLHANGIRFKVIGDLTRFDARLRDKIAASEALTESNTALTLTVAANYGGRWDILQAMNKAQQERVSANREVSEFSEDLLTPYLSMAYAPEPDLFIRTGGEQRLSNFLIWQLAYTEFYFTPELWPDFGRSSLIRAVDSYGKRERRFGRTSDQLAASLGISSDCTSDAA